MRKIIFTSIGFCVFVCIAIFAFEYSNEQASTFENVPGFESLDNYLIGSDRIQLKWQKQEHDSLMNFLNNFNGSSGFGNSSLSSLLEGLLGGSTGGTSSGSLGILQINNNIGHVNANSTNITGSNNTVTSSQSNSGFINNRNTNSTDFLNEPYNSGTVSNTKNSNN